MKPQALLAETCAPGGARLTLHAHDGHFAIRAGGQALMHSAASASEEQLGELTAEALRDRGGKRPRVLLGGLGLGLTLRRFLDRSASEVRVEVAELVPAIVAWNRGWLRELNGGALEDPRVTVRTGDVGGCLARGAAYAAIALDVDNGPVAMVRTGNAALYDERGVARLAAALAPGGRLLVWSAGPDRAFERRLAAAGFANVKAVPAPAHAGARSRGHVIFVAEKAA